MLGAYYSVTKIKRKGIIVMPRVSRSDSKIITNTYHILLRGINKQNIFIDKYDKDKFTKYLIETKEKYNYSIYSYVIMNNHVHLNIYDKEDRMSNIIHKLCTSYGMYFNKKYERVGHIFQNRFKSIGIDTEEYLLNLVRYIHRNPEKDGISKLNQYKWSSYNEYISNSKFITDIDFILDLFDEDRTKAIEKFVQYNKLIDRKHSDAEYEFESKLSDEDANYCIKRMLNIKNILAIQNYEKAKKYDMVYKISQIVGISSSQMVRLLGMSKRTIQRIIKECSEKSKF